MRTDPSPITHLTRDVLPIGRYRRLGLDGGKIEIWAGREGLQRARNVDKLLRDASTVGVDLHVCKEGFLWLKEAESIGIIVEEGESERGFPARANEFYVNELDSKRVHNTDLLSI